MSHKKYNLLDNVDDHSESDENVFLLENAHSFVSKSGSATTVKSLKNSRPKITNDLRVRNNRKSPKEDELIQLGPHRSSSAESKERPSLSSSDPNVIFIDLKLDKTDSLRNISLQYGISLAELKRCNNLLNEQDFYGRDSLKIPVQRYSLHTEQRDKLITPHLSASVAKSGSSPLLAHPALIDVDIHENLPSTSTANRSVHAEVIGAGVRSTPSPNGAEMLEAVDRNVDRVKRNVERLATPSVDNAPVDPLDDVDVYRQAALRANLRQSWWQRNVTHFVVVTLLVTVIVLVPLCFLIYELISAVEGDDSNSNVTEQEHLH